MAELLITPQSQLAPELECQILSFLRVTWPEGFVGENRLRNWITRIDHHPLSFMLVENRLLVAHAQVVWKMLAHAGETYKTYGLTGVFTYPSFRGQGYGLQVIRAATEYIAGSDADIGMFHCDPGLRGFYAQAGWRAVDEAVTLVGARDDPLVVNESMMLQVYSEKGRRGEESFARLPVFFDEDTTW